MTEIDVTLTDYAIAAECALFGFIACRWQGSSAQLHLDVVAFFFSVALAALAGGTVHGFFLNEAGTGYKILWRFTLVMIGVTALSGVRIGAAMLMTPSTAERVDVCAGVLFVIYVVVALFLWQDFRLAVFGYLPALVLLGSGLLMQFHTYGRVAALIGCLGVCTMVIAALVQQFRIAVSIRYFDHNALYHVLQAASLWMIFIAVRPATG